MNNPGIDLSQLTNLFRYLLSVGYELIQYGFYIVKGSIISPKWTCLL